LVIRAIVSHGALEAKSLCYYKHLILLIIFSIQQGASSAKNAVRATVARRVTRATSRGDKLGTGLCITRRFHVITFSHAFECG
jgi:hypothetical protein